MATSTIGSSEMEGDRGGLHPAVDTNRLKKKKKSVVIAMGRTGNCA